MDIRCRKTTCEYNNKYTCQAEDILVNKKLACTKFHDSKKTAIDISKSIFERTPNYAPQRDSLTITIKCDANCLLKKDSICRANGITLNDLGEPVCISYVRK